MERQQKTAIRKDLEKKMVFLTGPRQVGKTWLAADIARSFSRSVYLNYDSLADRDMIKSEAWLEDTELLVLDELHKMDGWKNYIKGVFDTRPAGMRILVTGSARLEAFRQGGDSLAGRFFRHRLLPFSPAETDHVGESVDMARFLNRGGFPEPFLADEDMDADRWRMQYVDGLVRTDILDFEKIHDFKAIQLIFELLRSRTGTPVSYQSLAEDAGVSPNTAKKYVQILESLFVIFRVTPYAGNIARSIVKTPKIYFYDTGLVIGDEGARFENMAALCLLKHVCGRVDMQGRAAGLHYVRTKDGAEVDFCLTEDNRPQRLIEVKRSDEKPGRALVNFCRRYDIPGIQLVLHLKHERQRQDIEVRRGRNFLLSLMI